MGVKQIPPITPTKQYKANPPNQTNQIKDLDQMLNSIGTSPPIKTFKNFNSETKFNKLIQN